MAARARYLERVRARYQRVDLEILTKQGGFFPKGVNGEINTSDDNA